MTLENKIKVSEKSLLSRFLNKVKTKLAPYVLASAAAITAMPGCSGGGHDNPPAPGNSNPNFTSAPVTSVWEGNSYSYDADAIDPEGDSITYSLASAPLWASINSSTGLVTGTPTGYSANATENLTVRATDSLGNAKDQNFNLNVTNLGTVSGNVKDYLSNNLGTITVHLYNTTFSKGRFNGLTDASGNFTIADTVLGGNNVPNDTFSVEAEDNYSTIDTYIEPNVVISGNTVVKNVPYMITKWTIASTHVAYDDSLGNPDSLALFKEMTRTRPSDTTQLSRSWGQSNYPVQVFLNAAGNSSGDSVDANLNPGANGVKDEIDAARLAISNINTSVGTTLFTETGSTGSSNIIRFTWPSTPPGGGSGLTSYTNMNANGTFDVIDVAILTGLSLNATRGVSEHELTAHCVDNLGGHTPDGNTYLRGATGTATTIHSDEGKVLRINMSIPHNTDMNRYKVK